MVNGIVENEIIDIGYYVGIFKCYFFWVILFVFVFIGLVVLFVMRMMLLYILSIIIFIEFDKINVVFIEEVYGLDIKCKDYM